MTEMRGKPPVNYDAEKALLACLMIDPYAAGDYVSQLREEDFNLPQNRVIFSAVRDLVRDDKTVELITVSDKLAMNDALSKAGGMEYLTAVSTFVPSAAAAREYFDIVSRNGILREIIDAGTEITKNGYTEESAEKALNFAEKKVFEISERHETSKLTPISRASAAAINRINAVQRGEFDDDGIKTGYPVLDRRIESLKPGTLCILAARPSIGKTAFALTVALNAAVNCGKKVAIFSYEMPVLQLVSRMLTVYSQVSLRRQRTPGMLTLAETQRLVDAHEALTNSRIYVDDNSANGPADIISKCRRLKNTEGLDLVIVDYMQLIALGERTENRQQEVSEISRRMKGFSKELDVPFLVLSQLSRGSEQRKEEPQLSDLRESGSIEQDADMVFFLHRVTSKNADSREEREIAETYDENSAHRFLKFIIGKNRNGELGTFYFDWNGDLQTFSPMDVRTAAPRAPEKKETAPVRTDDPFSGLKPVEDVPSESPAEDSAPDESLPF